MAAVDITFPGNLAQVDTANDLRSIPTSLIPEGALYLVGGLEGIFGFDPGSVSVDDGVETIRPFDRTPLQAGRWIKNAKGLSAGPAGPAGSDANSYASLAAMKAAGLTGLTYNLAAPSGSDAGYVNGPFTYQTGNFTGRTDVVALDGVPLTTGALVRQSASSVTFKGADTAAVRRPLLDKAQELPRSPADLGGIQGMFDAVVATGKPAPTALEDSKNYTITAPLTMNTMRVSLLGYSSITSNLPGVAALTITCPDTSEMGLSYGYKGRIGSIRIKGSSGTNGSVGVDLNSATEGSSAQIGADGLVVWNFGIGLRFSNRAYNNTFYRTEVLGVDTCAFWPAGGEDNGERNTFISCVLYNSEHALVNNEPSGSMYYYSGSIDYTAEIASVNAGKIFLTDSHLESDRWQPDPLKAVGDGGYIKVTNGFLLNRNEAWNSPYLASVEPGARIDIDGTFVHNLTMIRESVDTPTAWFHGGGLGLVRNTHGFQGSQIPDRLSNDTTLLADPSFESPTWDDLVWLAGDAVGSPIVDRHAGTNIALSKSTAAPRGGGSKSLAAAKATGTGSQAAFGILMSEVRYGDKIMAGLHYRLDPTRPGDGANFAIRWNWGRLDRYDANGLPIWFKTGLIFSQPLTATAAWQMSVFGKIAAPAGAVAAVQNNLSARTAGTEATHFYGVVDMFNTGQTTLLFDDVWVDRW